MKKTYFSQRRSIRKFSGKPVEDEMLKSILEEAMKAPTTGNMQLYSVIITRGEEGRKKLAPLHFSQPAATGAPVMLTVCADLYRFSKWCELSKADAGFDNMLSFMSAFADAIIYSQQVVTIAEQNGLGTCYLGTVTYNAPEISELLELPDMVVPVACIALGWPDGEGEETERLPLESVVSEETYKILPDAEIMNFYKVKEDFTSNRKYVEENHKDNLAQVFAEVRYPRQMNETFSEKFIKFLETKGFIK